MTTVSSFHDCLPKKKKKEYLYRAGQIKGLLLKGFAAHHGEIRLDTTLLCQWISVGLGSLTPETVPP